MLENRKFSFCAIVRNACWARASSLSRVSPIAECCFSISHLYFLLLQSKTRNLSKKFRNFRCVKLLFRHEINKELISGLRCMVHIAFSKTFERIENKDAWNISWKCFSKKRMEDDPLDTFTSLFTSEDRVLWSLLRCSQLVTCWNFLQQFKFDLLKKV